MEKEEILERLKINLQGNLSAFYWKETIYEAMEIYANLRISEQKEKHDKEMEEFAEWKAKITKRNKDLFREIVPNVYFKAVTSKNDDGWMQCDCGNSGIDGEDHYVVTTHNLKGDEVPDLCQDSKTFAELVARLLNKHYNS